MLDHRLEGAILAAMRELAAIHIEADRALDCFAIRDEEEACLCVDEALDQPDRCQAINKQTVARHPAAPLISSRIDCDTLLGVGLRWILVAYAQSFPTTFIS